MKGERPSEARLYFLLAWMVVFWAVNYVVGKIALREFPSLLLACLRTQGAAAAILPIYFWKRPNDRSIWSRSALLRLFLVGVFGLVMNQLLFVIGLARTSVAHTALGVSFAPVLVLLLAAALGQEHVTRRKIGGLGVAVAGVMVLQLSKESGSTATLAGDAYMLLFGCAFALFSVKGKELSSRFGTLTVNTFAYTSGALLLIPVTLWQSRNFDFARVTPAAWWSLFFMAVFPAVLASMIYYYALTYLPASRVSAVLYIQPLLATLLAIPALGEPVSASLAIGGILILIGVFLTERA